MPDTVKWLDYEFQVYGPNTDWNEVAGLYIFAGLNSEGRWVALYIGSTESLAERLPTHENWQEAVRLGATHIHARGEQHKETRLALEQELIQAYQPRLNVQHR